MGDANIAKDQRPLHVVHMTAEMAPIAKVGGLGDVVTGLARACLLRGHTVEVSALRCLAHVLFLNQVVVPVGALAQPCCGGERAYPLCIVFRLVLSGSHSGRCTRAAVMTEKTRVWGCR